MTAQINESFWNGRKVFLTGHTGFKGSWLSIWLTELGAEVKGFSLKPKKSNNLFDIANISNFVQSDINDINDYDALTKSINIFKPEVVIHMAAQPLVLESYIEPINTYKTNVIGTANILEASRHCNSIKAILNITTDKCYENFEHDYAYKEDDQMGGHDPYSSSKGCAELVTTAYRKSFFNLNQCGLASVRAGNVIGGGDWSDDRLIPDILRSFEKEEIVTIRNPRAIRPWQHVLEPLSGYLNLIEKLYTEPQRYSSGWNFGPNETDVKSVEWIVKYMSELWPNSLWKIDEKNKLHEAQLLRLDISKAKNELNWFPKWNIEKALKKIIEWHKLWLSDYDMYKICVNEIKEYSN